MSHVDPTEPTTPAAASSQSYAPSHDGASPHSLPSLSGSQAMASNLVDDQSAVRGFDGVDKARLSPQHAIQAPSPHAPHSSSQDILEDEDWHDLNATQGSVPPQGDISIEHFDWESVMQRFHDRMQDNRSEDLVLEDRFWKLMEFYTEYRSFGIVHEQERAAKRLCTRVAFVRNAEQKVKSQRGHYESVRNAFQGALNLLSSGATRDEQQPD